MNETTNDEQIDSEIQRLENRLLYYPSIHNKNKDDNINKSEAFDKLTITLVECQN